MYIGFVEDIDFRNAGGGNSSFLLQGTNTSTTTTATEHQVRSVGVVACSARKLFSFFAIRSAESKMNEELSRTPG